MGTAVGVALVWFIIEMLIWYLIAQFISGWWVFAWFVVAAIIGIMLMRKGMAVLNPMAQQIKSGGMFNPAMRPPESTIMKTVAMALAGVLLLIPGLISDVLAVIVLLPPVQNKFKTFANNYVQKNQEKMMQMMAKQMGGMAGFPNMGDLNQMGGMGQQGQHPFGNNPFNHAGKSPFGGGFAKGNFGRTTTTVEGTAKDVKKDIKKLSSANDE